MILFDIETTAIKDNDIYTVSDLYSIVVYDFKNSKLMSFTNYEYEKTGNLPDGLELLSNSNHLVGHNIIAFDIPVLKHLTGISLWNKQVTDTLIWSRLQYPNMQQLDYKFYRNQVEPSLYGSHSLGAWGKRLNENKIEYKDFSFWTPEMQKYCEQDVLLNVRLYEYLSKYKNLVEGECLELEHWFSKEMALQKEVGVIFNYEKALEIQKETQARLTQLEQQLSNIFSPKISPVYVNEDIEVKTPTRCSNNFGIVNANPNLHLVPKLKELISNNRELIKQLNYFKKTEKNNAEMYSTKILEIKNEIQKLQGLIVDYSKFIGAAYCPVEIDTFNPKSRKQIAKRLKEKYLIVFDETEKGNPKVDAKALKNIQYDAAKLLVEYLDTSKFASQLEDGDKSWLKYVRHGKDGLYRIHGTVKSQGALTGRCTHNSPNLAQVPKTHLARSLFLPHPDYKLVGWDASSLEARVLAHFLTPYDNGAYRDAFLSGEDVHEKNRQLFSLFLRDSAKTLWYGIQYGSGNRKAGLISYNDLLEVLSRLEKVKENKIETEKVIKLIDLAKDRYNVTSLEDIVTKIKQELNSWNFEERGKNLKETVFKQIPALKQLIDDINKAIYSRGFIYGLDKRKIYVDKEKTYKALNYLIQGAGAIIMKKSLQLLDNELVNRGFIKGEDYSYLLNIHDEIQAQVKEEYVDVFIALAPLSIRQAGDYFKFRCPLDGDVKVGKNWAETH